MTPQPDERAFIDGDTQGAFAEFFERVLQQASPQSVVAGGGTEDTQRFQRRPRNFDNLTDYRDAYQSGGPVADMIDKRAFMTYGPGIEFSTSNDTLTDDRGRTVDEWLRDAFGDTLDHFQIQSGIQSYWSGNAFVETVETRGGDLSHLRTIDPTTVHVDWDRHGDVTGITQWIRDSSGSFQSVALDPDSIAILSFTDTPGGPLERGLFDRNWDELQRYAQNQEQRKNAIRLHGSPHYHVKVGSESQSIPDRLIRKVRDRFSSEQTDEKTNWVTGGDIDIDEKDSPGFDGMENITETDLAQLAQGFGLPLELTNFGSDGLGSGKPAEVRWQAFERQARSEQKLRIAQFMSQIVRPVIERYSPFPRDISVDVRFGDVVSDQQAVAEWMRDFKSYLTPEEVRERLDLGDAPADADLGPPEGTPDAESPTPEGGLFAAGGGVDGQERAASTLWNGSADTSDAVIGDGGGAVGQQTRRSLLHTDVSDADLTEEELVFERMFERVIWDDATDRSLFAFDPEEVPDFAVERLENAVREGAVFDNFDTIPDWAAQNVEDVMLDSLEKRHGWSVDSIATNLQDMALGLSKQEAETIARTETAALVNTAREEGYEEQFGDDALFKWVGPSNTRTTEACEWLKEQTNPEFGGDPVTLSRLKDLVQEAPTHDDDMPDDLAREWVVHPNERHTYVRVVE